MGADYRYLYDRSMVVTSDEVKTDEGENDEKVKR